MKLDHLFKLPETEECSVLWFRNNKMSKTVIRTPNSCDGLQQIMLARHHVGYSEIRAVEAASRFTGRGLQAINPASLLQVGGDWGRR